MPAMTAANTIMVGTSSTALNLVTLYTISLTADNMINAAPDTEIAAAASGTLTTRSSSTAGTLTMDTGHGITTGARLDIFWDGGAGYGATVGTVSVNSVPFTGLAGTALPVVDSAITAQVPVSSTVTVTGNNAVFFAGYTNFGPSDGYGNIIVTQSNNTLIAAYQVYGSSPGVSWNGAGVATNPFAGVSVGKVFFAQGNTSAKVMGTWLGYDS